MTHLNANYGPTTEKGREIQLQRRKDIVTQLQNLPVPEGSKAYDIIWNAVEVIQGYESELMVTVARVKDLKDQMQTQQDRLDDYFGGA